MTHQKTIYTTPGVGEVGRLHAVMYRGVQPAEARFDDRFASDPGDYGAGEYWTDDREFASNYGEAHERELDIDRVYHIPPEELMRTIREFGTCRMVDGHAKRMVSAKLLTEHFQTLGYAAVLTSGYETFGALGLCIFAGMLDLPR